MFRYWHKADMACALHMSAFDPKRTLEPDIARTLSQRLLMTRLRHWLRPVRLTPFPAPFKVNRLSRVGPLGKPAKIRRRQADGLASGLLFCAEEISAEVVVSCDFKEGRQ